MNRTIKNFLIPVFTIITVGLYGQDDCPDDLSMLHAPGENDPGCIEYTDCNDNGAFDVGEPCFDAPPEGDYSDTGDHDGEAGKGDHGDGYYCAICDEHFETAEEMDQHAADMGHTLGGSDQGCNPEGDYPENPPGEGEGCMAYEDCNGNGVFDIGEPCHDGPPPGDGEGY